MTARRFDLPLESTAASRFLPWLVAALVYLAVIALGVAAVADGALKVYGMRARLVTVTIPAVEDPIATERDRERAIDLLQRAPGVTSATAVAPEELEELIAPWVGNVGSTSDLPLPQLIDVTFDSSAPLDLGALQAELRQVVPGATLGIEAMSRNRAERLAVFFRAWSGVLGVLILLGALGVAIWITRLSLEMNTDTVELIRFMGAPDIYLARQFEWHALLNSVRGGLIGFGLGVLTLILLLWTSRRMELAGAIELTLRPVDWILLACVPVVGALLITAVTRITALWGLNRMP
jgi:cell division transport system permease protein